MAAKKICEVCGKEYETCRPIRITEPFRWQEVACCPEHGRLYFEKTFGSIYADFLKKQGIAVESDVKETVGESECALPEDAYEYGDELDDEEEDNLGDDDYDE